jgi:hypothetical protein
MGFVFRLEDYVRYLERVGAASYVDATRRSDPARVAAVWDNLEAVRREHGAPWVVQLWTKDLGGALALGRPVLERLVAGGATLAAQLTVTGLAGSRWEPGNGAAPFGGVVGEAEKSFAVLAGGASHVTWRFDPVIPTVHEPARFRRLADRAAALGIERCVVNFVAPPGRYRRVDARLGPALPGWAEGMPGYDEGWCAAVAADLLGAARERGLTLAVCAESAALAARVPGLGRAACGDHDWFVALSGRDPVRPAGRGSRPGCGCAPYFDVGAYGQWRRCHRCLYCYAG